MSSKLEGRDFTIVVDRSGSMSAGNGNGQTRWQAAQEGAVALARKCAEFDPDGIEVIMFATKAIRFADQSPEKVDQLFKEHDPMGSTNLTGALDVFFSGYFERKKTGTAKAKGEIAVFITDGEPNDRNSAAEAIINATKKLDREDELGMTFIQVGNDSGATDFLKFLDDDLENLGAKFDIVDTIRMQDCEDIPLTQVLLNALED